MIGRYDSNLDMSDVLGGAPLNVTNAAETWRLELGHTQLTPIRLQVKAVGSHSELGNQHPMTGGAGSWP